MIVEEDSSAQWTVNVYSIETVAQHAGLCAANMPKDVKVRHYLSLFAGYPTAGSPFVLHTYVKSLQFCVIAAYMRQVTVQFERHADVK